jgi:hypothetical protein
LRFQSLKQGTRARYTESAVFEAQIAGEDRFMLAAMHLASIDDLADGILGLFRLMGEFMRHQFSDQYGRI